MNKKKSAKLKSEKSKKDVAREVHKKLEIALLSFKEGINVKKFEKGLKKASKAFADHIRNSVQKRKPKKAKPGSKLKGKKTDKAKK